MQAHMHKMLGPWLQEHVQLRDRLCQQAHLTVPFCLQLVHDLSAAVHAAGRDYPVPQLSARQLARQERDAAVAGAKAEQAREDAGVAALNTQQPPIGQRPGQRARKQAPVDANTRVHVRHDDAGAERPRDAAMARARMHEMQAAREARLAGGTAAETLGGKIAALNAVADGTAAMVDACNTAGKLSQADVLVSASDALAVPPAHSQQQAAVELLDLPASDHESGHASGVKGRQADSCASGGARAAKQARVAQGVPASV